MGAIELFDLAVELGVDRVQLLVDRLQLLLGGFELLVGRLQLLVHRLELLVRRLQLLERALVFLDGPLQPLARVAQLPLELIDPFVAFPLSWLLRGLRGCDGRSHILEHHQKERCIVFFGRADRW